MQPLSPGHHAGADAGCLMALTPSTTHGGKSSLAWRTGGDNDGHHRANHALFAGLAKSGSKRSQFKAEPTLAERADLAAAHTPPGVTI